MSFSSASLNHLINDTTTFRAWGVAFAAALEAAGLIKTADTGQIDWTTVTYATSTTVPRGYEIRRFSDALQATAPIFVKIFYGNNTGGGVQLYYIFGAGSNGTGTITGNTYVAGTTPTSFPVDVTTSTNPRDIWTSYGTGRVSIFYNADESYASNEGAGFGIQRTVDEDGVTTGEGFFVIVGHINGMVENYYEFSSGVWRNATYFRASVSGSDTIGFPILPPYGQTGMFGDEVNALPFIGIGRRGYHPTLPDWIFVHYTSQLPGEEQSFDHIGASYEFIMTGCAPQNLAGVDDENRAWRWCIRSD